MNWSHWNPTMMMTQGRIQIQEISEWWEEFDNRDDSLRDETRLQHFWKLYGDCTATGRDSKNFTLPKLFNFQLIWFTQLIRTGISLPISSHNRPYYSTSKTTTEHISTVSSFLILDFKHNLVEANWKTRQMFRFCTIFYETWTSSAFKRKYQEAKTTDVSIS